jgi:glycosyltransferase involved in cell wall biosynthesis
MKICVVGPSKRFFSGITNQTIFLSNALAKRNQVSVLLLRNLLPRFLFPGHERIGKDQYSVNLARGIDAFDGMDYNSPLSWIKAFRFLSAHKPDAIIMLWWTSSVAHMQLILKTMNYCAGDAKMILEMHEVVDPLEENILPLRLYSRIMGRGLVRGLDAYTTKSEFNKMQVAQIYGINDNKIFVIPHGLYEEYAEAPDTELAKSKLGITEEYNILYFGLIRHYKGVPHLIEAFDSLPPSIANKSRLLIVGEIWEEGEKLRDMIHASQYRNHISLIDEYVPDEMLPLYFAAADVVALPYLRAAGSGVAHMAMTYGKPIILSEVEALKETLSDYTGAIFVPPGDSHAIEERILETYQAAKSGGVSRYAVSHPTWDDIARLYEDIIDSLDSERSRG